MKHHSFKLLDSYHLDDINCDAFIYKHTQSGAHLMYLKNDDTNKVFSATFKTPPTDHTGVPHIVEHCVLSGSRKYHTKEPFMDLVKGSMNTFVNAMTFSDKTMYPVASKNEKDFYNLMDVYLDAVFFPKIYDTEDIFMQEGWRYDVHHEADPLTYKGVVYNEMKGAYSDPSRPLFQLFSETLYDGSPYAFESGGHPEHITSLTYEDFLAFHKKHYHPSNAYLYVYGNVDINKVLEHIHSDYLVHFKHEDSEPVTILPKKPLTENRFAHGTYALSEDEDPTHKDYMVLGFPIGLTTDHKTHFMAALLGEILIKASASPLKKALLDAEIAEDIDSSYDDGLYRTFSVALINTCCEHKERFISIVKDTLKQMVEEGIDESLKLSAINALEYGLRESRNFATKGIIHHMLSMESWLYSNDATLLLRYSEALDAFKKEAKGNGIEAFIEEHILNAPFVFCSTSPDKNLSKHIDQTENAALLAHKAALSPEALKALIDKNQKLKIKQLSPDSPEAVASIPRITRNDIDKHSEVFPINIVKELPFEVLHAPHFTNGITYVDFFFDISDMPEELYPYAEIVSTLLGEINTRNRSYETLSTTIKLHTGGFRYSVSTLKAFTPPHQAITHFTIQTKATSDKLPYLTSLLLEVLKETQFDDAKRVKERLKALKSQLQSHVIDHGNAYVVQRLASYLTAADRRIEGMNGFSFYFFVSQLLESFDENSGRILENLKHVFSLLFNQKSLKVSVTCDDETMTQALPLIEAFALELNEAQHISTLPHALVEIEPIIPNEGIKSSATVQFVGQGVNLCDYGHVYNGHYQVLSTWLNGEFLHDRVRAKGGAYGCRATVDYTGFFSIASYRDPNLSETYDVYSELEHALKTLDLDQDAVEKLIIGTISKVDGAKTPHDMGKLGTIEHFIGKTFADKQKLRDDILATTPQTLSELANAMATFSAHGLRCTLGNAQTLEKSSELFDKLIKLQA